MVKLRGLFCYVLFLLLFSPAMVLSADLEGFYPPMEIESELLASPKIAGMVFVKGGCFDMGDTFGDGKDNEKPVHEVCVDDFYMSKYEVTVGEYREFIREQISSKKKPGCIYMNDKQFKLGANVYWLDPGFVQTDENPVACVSWFDAQDYIDWKSINDGRKYRFPTEAEWEYAARERGKKIRWAGTSDETELGEYAWYGDNSDEKTHPVGTKKPNALGLYDMSGNVYEWVNDWYDINYYGESPRDNPKGPSDGLNHVLRGGSWIEAADSNVTFRFWSNGFYRYYFIGFRLALSADAQK